MRSLGSRNVRYLLIGGLAVAYHGYSRLTADMDIWVAADPANIANLIEALREFGFDVPELNQELFADPRTVVRMGEAPWRIEVLMTLSGVSFEECYSSRIVSELAGIEVNVISLADLKTNTRAAGRPKDLADLDYLP